MIEWRSHEEFEPMFEGFCSETEFVIDCISQRALSDVVYVYVSADSQVLYVGETSGLVARRMKSQAMSIHGHLTQTIDKAMLKNGNFAYAQRWVEALKGVEFVVYVKQAAKTVLHEQLVSLRHAEELALIAKFKPLLNRNTK